MTIDERTVRVLPEIQTLKVPVLCYVTDPWAYFTTRVLDEQWGDDWNDAPYDCNAGRPYTDTPSLGLIRETGEWVEWVLPESGPRWRIDVLAYQGGLYEPTWIATAANPNVPWSVQDINAGAVPWLQTMDWHTGPAVRIMAGTPMDEFIRLVQLAKGRVYAPIEGQQ